MTIDIETQAVRSLEVVSPFNKEILTTGLVKDVYTDEFGNLEEACLDIEKELQNGLADYRKGKRDVKRSPAYANKFTIARDGLSSTLTEFDKLWIRGVLPKLKENTEKVAEKAEKEEIKVDDKNDLLDNAKKTVDIIDKIIESGKKVWELVTEHKDVFASVGKFLVWLV